MAWAFYNSNGQIVGGYTGAWVFYDANGLVQSTIVGGGGGGSGEPTLGGDHLHGLARWIAGGGATFELPDVAEYLEHVFNGASLVDPATFSLSADRTQLIFDSAPTAGNIVNAEYVIARL